MNIVSFFQGYTLQHDCCSDTFIWCIHSTLKIVHKMTMKINWKLSGIWYGSEGIFERKLFSLHCTHENTQHSSFNYIAFNVELRNCSFVISLDELCDITIFICLCCRQMTFMVRVIKWLRAIGLSKKLSSSKIHKFQLSATVFWCFMKIEH